VDMFFLNSDNSNLQLTKQATVHLSRTTATYVRPRSSVHHASLVVRLCFGGVIFLCIVKNSHGFRCLAVDIGEQHPPHWCHIMFIVVANEGFIETLLLRVHP
jgi:hypothetical protein